MNIPNKVRRTEKELRMKQKLFVLFGLIAAVSIGAAAADRKPSESQWTAAPVLIDGQLKEWPPESLQTYEDYGIQYGFKNDAYFLYCALVFNDPKYLSSLEASGMTFWINPEKEKKTYGFRFYRKAITADQLILEMEKGGTPLTDERRAQIKAKRFYQLFACDVVDKKGNIVPHPGVSGGTYRLAKVEKALVLEYIIPLALLKDPNAATAFDPAKPLKVGFEWGGMTDEMRRQRASEIGDQNARGGNGDVAMAVSGGVGERSESDSGGASSASLEGMRRGPKKYDFWIDLKLAEKKNP